MVLMRNLKRTFLMFVFVTSNIFAAVNFGSKDSAFKISDSASLDIDTGLSVADGTIYKKTRDSGVLGADITFDQGYLRNVNSESFLTAAFSPETSGNLIILDGTKRVRAESGEILPQIQVSGENNIIEGQPTFHGTIDLQDASSTLTLAIQSQLNKNIVLAGGKLVLGDHLDLADNVVFSGNAHHVVFNGKRITFGGKDTSWAGKIFWDNANDMVLNSKITLTNTWTFMGESHITGNGNILDLSDGGILCIKKNTTLHLRDIKLRGLGNRGRIIFSDETSHLRLSDAQIEMDGDYSVTCGGIYVDGESTIYVSNWILRFEQRGSMTVDGTCLWFDLLRMEDKVADWDSIKPVEIDDPTHKYIEYLNNGIIRRVSGDEPGPIIWSGVDYLHEDLWLSPDNRIVVTGDKVVFGRSHSIHFSRTSDQTYLPLIEIRPGVSLTLLNVVLENFTEQHLGLDVDASITFSDQTTLELPHDAELNMTWTFIGDCVLRGKGHALTFSEHGKIVVLKALPDKLTSSLLFDDIKLEGIVTADGADGTKIVCYDYRCTLSFNDVIWEQDGNYSFTMGKFEVLGDFQMKGANTFAYKTTQSSRIWNDARMTWDSGFTFSYDPPITCRTLIQMEDSSSEIFMNGATLASTLTGIMLSKGKLILDDFNWLVGVGNSLGNGIAFGDGSNDLNIEIMPSASITLVYGYLDYKNAS